MAANNSHTAPLNPPTSPTPPTRVAIDPDGDLSLIVGKIPELKIAGMQDQIVTFVVCSRSLSRASAFWKTLLYGKFAESKRPESSKAEEWRVELPGDQPEPMKMLLRIIHSQFEHIPTAADPIGLRTLYQLTVLTDKYDLTRFLRPWARNWMNSMPLHITPPACLADFMDLRYQAWIAWELGDEDMLVEAAKILVAHCNYNPKLGVLGPFCFGIHEPPGLLSLVTKTRLKAIDMMLTPFKNAISKLIEGTTPVCSNRSLSRDQLNCHQDCDITMLGVTIQSLSRHKLWPIPKPEDVQTTVSELAITLKKVDTKSRLHSHSCRAVPSVAEAADIVNRAFPEIEEAQIRHLDSQAKKSGLSS
ncbi:hypothetical protein F5B20DRAFT_554102 [Whalleya microplaca]|nr:hypothetical protein F5B20DRAFT_554102 [Whalleya microplaca]